MEYIGEYFVQTVTTLYMNPHPYDKKDPAPIRFVVNVIKIGML